MKTAVAEAVYRFAGFTFDIARGALLNSKGEEIPLRPKSFDLLRLFVESSGRLLDRDTINQAIWPRVVVTDDAITQCIRDIRRALGDEAQRMLRTVPRRGYLFSATVSTTGSPELNIRYCRTPSGVRLAYAVVGQGPPLVRCGRWFTHLEYEWKNSAKFPNAILKDLATEFQLLRYDARGTGMSDWEADEISLETWVQDLDTVVNAAGLERFALLGKSQSAAVAITYAARHPERVSKLILYGGYTLGWRKRPGTNIEQHEAMKTLMRIGWGSENPAYRQMFTSQFLPEGTKEQFDALNELQRLSTSAEGAVRYYDATGDVDVIALLPKIAAPTLVMHVREDADVPFEMGRQVAAGIPGARFVALPGKSHALMSEDPALARYLEEIQLFLRMKL